MAVESASDRTAYVADFGTSGTWTLSAGGASTVIGIFDNEWLAKDTGAGALVESKIPMIHCVDAALPAGAGRGDTWADGVNTYVVTEIQPDGTGFSIVMLDLQ